MKRTYARALTRLYAPAWRRQYGDEFEALLLDLPMTSALVFDVLSGTLRSAPLPACRSYSSVAQSGVVVRRQCLD